MSKKTIYYIVGIIVISRLLCQGGIIPSGKFYTGLVCMLGLKNPMG